MVAFRLCAFSAPGNHVPFRRVSFHAAPELSDSTMTDSERAGWRAWAMVTVIVIAYVLCFLWVLGMVR